MAKSTITLIQMEKTHSSHKFTTLDRTDSDALEGTDAFPDTRDSISAMYYNSNASSKANRTPSSNTARLHRQDARRNGTTVTVPNSQSDEPGIPLEPTHVLSSMLNNLSSELAQKGAITSTKGFCHACHKPIVGVLISAMDKEWHPDHFTCANCGIGLVRVDFYERDDKPYCLECHARLFSPKCAYCGEAILEKCIVALSRTWHPEHFFCYGCQRAFNDSVTVHEHEDKVYCPPCYLDRFGTRCQGCNQPITDSYITALNAPWHRNCFACQECAKPLSGSNFHDVDGYPLCEAHYYTRRGLICSTCTKPITGRCVNALGKRYHPLHFVCAYCLQPLQSGTFKEHTNKPYCHQCFLQLFG
ncbi:Leupaxin [Fasciolopsis buskii]|uniref:Leupaxin n=1 Tax=Fasciolopsis buskii TaxID=27845 RepID=A0A8E0RT40_9TREM|nr:Leupaxin [Fasciolopsis buski]